MNIRPTAALTATQTQRNHKCIDLMCMPMLCASFTVLGGTPGSSGHSVASPWPHLGVESQQVITGHAGCFITELPWPGWAFALLGANAVMPWLTGHSVHLDGPGLFCYRE